MDIYNKLYDEYDRAKKSNNVDEMDRIKLEVDKLSLPKTDSQFQPYPDHHDEDFSEIIYKKKEFHSNQLFLDTTGMEDSCGSEFSIKPHQSFLKNFITKESPYKSLLMYHGVGVGKTCSGLTIAENFRDPLSRKDKRIIVLSSKNIQIGWKKTIYDPDKSSYQCTGDTFTDSGANTNRQVNKLVKQYYEIMAYQSFSNFVTRMETRYSQALPKEEQEQGKIDCIRDYFSNRYMIIDEVHNIRDEQDTNMRETIKTIERVIKHSDNLRLVLLTATPMYNRVTEILWILNMMLLNDKRPTIDKKEVFDREGELTPEGEDLIKKKCRGYISYLRGENPMTFPIRLYPGQLDHYPSKNIISNKNNPTHNLVGGKIKEKDRLQFLDLFGSRMAQDKKSKKDGLQLQIYKRSIQELLDNNPDIDIEARGEVNPITDNIVLTQITDMVYPSEKANIDELSIDEFYGEKGLNNCMNRSGSRYSYKTKITNKYKGPIFDKDILPEFSCKIASIIESVDDSDGIVFIYTNYINSGTIPLQLALEHNGYKKHTGEPILKFPEWTKSADKYKTKREPISYAGKRRSEVSDRFIQGKYMVIDGSISKKLLQHQLKIVNSDDNKHGERIKIIIGTVVASEGLDFKRIRSVHILDPWLHLNRIEQTVGRSIRFCSHADLPGNEKNVLIYLHVTTLPKKGPETEQESIDVSIYRYAEKKSIEIGKVEDILKRNAVDRYLFRDINVIKKGSIQKVTMKSSLRSAKEVENVDPSDKPYSKVCSYLEDCDYNEEISGILNKDCRDIKDKKECNKGSRSSCKYSDSLKLCEYKLDEDTFIEQYSSTAIHNLKRKVGLLYKESYVYDLDSIMGLLREYGTYQDTMTYLAISEMIIHKFIVYDKHGNSGYLINSDSYYIFQPFLMGDEGIPLYYRMNLIHKQLRPITLPRLNEVIDVCDCNKVYSVDRIEDVYNKLSDDLARYQVDVDELGSNAFILNELKDIYKDMSSSDIIIVGYLFDRLLFEDKCKLMYGYLHMLEFKEFVIYDNLRKILQSYIIYRSIESEKNYYFNNELTDMKDVTIFGFVFSYNDKPCFYEYHAQEIMECNQLQLININKSLKRYSSTQHFKQFKKTTLNWGYTIRRTRKKDSVIECVLKFVQPSIKGKSETTKYPPGPGNVCIESSMGADKDYIKAIINEDYSELSPLLGILEEEDKDKKKNLCFLLELALRHNKTNSFFSYDKVWLKYK